MPTWIPSHSPLFPPVGVSLGSRFLSLLNFPLAISVQGLHTTGISDFLAGISCLWAGAGKWMPAFILKIVRGTV